MKPISVFEILKTSIGPSSSHTMGPWLAASQFLESTRDQQINSLHVKLFGSLAKTGKGHGTDVAVILGLSGWNIERADVGSIHSTVNRVRRSCKLTLPGGQQIDFDPQEHIEFISENPHPHPNTLTFEANIARDRVVSRTYSSVGGGFILEDGQNPVDSLKVQVPYPIQRGRELIKYSQDLDLSIPEIVMQNELAWQDEANISQRLDRTWEVMLACIFRGCTTEGILPGGLNVERRASRICKELLDGSSPGSVEDLVRQVRVSKASFVNVVKWVSCFALAVNEENASFGRVVTAPTNGAAGVIPAVLMYLLCFGDDIENENTTIRDFLLTAGEFGSLFKKGATISGALGGCQAEIGVASAMAAGALTSCLGGSAEQVIMAGEIAMEHHLGLTCDPVGGLVQVPCIERNTMGAIKAITASQIALSSDSTKAKVSLDSVITVMKETAADMQEKYKETAEGGLAYQIPVNVVEC